MTDYSKMEGGDLLQALGDDANKWAEAYIQMHPGLPDEHNLMGWFANAIEHSFCIRTGTVLNGSHAEFLAERGLDAYGKKTGDCE